jgi:hypothetical protein
MSAIGCNFYYECCDEAMFLSTHSKQYFCCLAGAITNRFSRQLGVLLVASVGMLLFADASLAHVPDQRDDERSTQYSELILGGVHIRVSVPAEFADGMRTIVSVAAFLDQPWIGQLDADRDKCNDDEDGDDCCGAACHASINDIGNDACARRPPLSAAVPRRSPSLLGRSQDPPERPPRLA